MNMITFILAILLFLIFLIKKNKNSLVIYLFVVMMLLIVVYPDTSINAAKNGIHLCLYVIMPSLLPFFIINDMLISLKFPDMIAKLFYKISYKLFNTSGYGIYTFIMSIFSGYPSGAKIVSDLLKDKKISQNEGQLILTFSSTSGPLFIVGAVGTGMLSNPMAGYVLLFSHIIGSIINGIIFKNIIPNKNHIYYNSNISNSTDIKIGKMLSNSIINSVKTIALVSGYVILFSVIIALIDKTLIISNVLNIIIPNYIINKSSIVYNSSNVIKSFLELSNGCNIISMMKINSYMKMCILSFLLSFSCFSIILQVSSVLANTNIKIGIYILTKIAHGFLSAFVCYITLLFIPSALPTFKTSSINWPLDNCYILMALLCILLIISIVSFIKSKHETNIF